MILGAVITDGMVIQRLTNYIWVGLNSVLSESHISDLAQILFALKMSLKTDYLLRDPAADG